MDKMLEKYQDSPPCACDKCKSCCQRPCWGTPSEIQKLIDAGFNRLMYDYWVRSNEEGGDIDIICPALKGYENRAAPFWPEGQCTFQDENGLCELHDLGLKPLEGRVVHCKASFPSLHEDVAMTWDTEEGKAIVSLFMKA
jgi:hypothetical protein